MQHFGGTLAANDISVHLGADAILERVSLAVTPGSRIGIVGPNGRGKTTLLRALAGIWPFGRGRIELPARARMLFLPQRPYLPLGSLRAATSYPEPEGAFPDERIIEVLRLLGLGHLEARLDEVESWDDQLSGDEQQRLALGRALLYEPEWLFLDKATSELDEAMERRVYDLFAARLPATTLISVAHRPAVEAYHAKRWVLAPRDHGPAVLEPA